ncbi:MAG: hypothetical protein ACKV2V_01980 [Blastocatellia bacterium]
MQCETTRAPGRYRLQFLDKFAGMTDLADRVAALRLTAGTTPLTPEIQANGAYRFTLESTTDTAAITLRFTYTMRLARALDPGNYPLTSGLAGEYGSILLDDLLPRLCPAGAGECAATPDPLRLRLTLPPAWRAATTETQNGDVYEIADPSRAVFFLGVFREQEIPMQNGSLRLVMTGQWGFPEKHVAGLVEIIARRQAEAMGEQADVLPVGDGPRDFLITLAPYPLPLTGLRSSALTRGHTIILMLNQNTTVGTGPSRALRHYARHLAHEMFHFYLPGAFATRENFDWFWEGFTRYMALTTLREAKLFDLDDYLDALSDEYESWYFNPLRGKQSLISASAEKFADLATYELVYRKGMLVAGLYDLELRWQSRGRKNLPLVMRQLYRQYALRRVPVGNREVLAELARHGDFRGFIRDYIESAHDIDLPEILRPYGLALRRNALTNRMAIKPLTNLSPRQKALIAAFEN